MLKITRKQYIWLDCHGGRSERDVKENEDGMYVLMGNGDGGSEQVYIPNDQDLVRMSYSSGHDFVELVNK